jgi:Tol biopolymer transport system component/tRNA A-37 threonylcarbamoyl transferase component Bud32
MELSPGLQLGPYEVVSLVGMGGMGEVYRARDTRLGRFVAIKVLPSRYRSDEMRLRRFEQEARAVSSLSHPNILALHDVGIHGDAPYIVSELLEGETLAERLQSGPLPVRKAVELGVALAHALAAAYEKGIVHRDLKPENVFLTSDGRVKILDFGLSKLVGPGASDDGHERMTRPFLTDTQTVVGTAGYMSPEQVRGKTVDHRSDVFALGTILYEALSGRRAFIAESPMEAMSLILTKEPLLTPEEQPAVPAVLARIVAHCMEKSPEERFQSARDLAFQLESLSTTPTAALPIPAPVRRVPRGLALAAAALLVGAALGAVAMRVASRTRGAAATPELQRLTFRRGLVRAARFAPDGQSVVYSASWEGEPVRIYSARPGTPESRPLDFGDAELLDLSPQGELAVLLGTGEKRYSPRRQGRVLARVPLGGGTPRELMRDVLWAAWSPDGTSLAVVREAEGKQRLEYPAGTVLFETSGWISYPRVSPDGASIAFLDHPVKGDDRGDVSLVDRKGTKRTISTGWSSLKGLAFARAGRELWYAGTSGGMSRAIFASILQGGAPRAISRMAGQLLLHDVSKDDRALVTHDSYEASLEVLVPGAAREVDLAWLDSSGVNDLSKDGRTLLFTEQGDGGGARYAVYVRKVDGPAVRLGDGQGLALSPDETRALAVLYDGPTLEVLPTGIGEPKTLPRGAVREVHWGDFTPDGTKVVFLGNLAGGGPRLFVQSLSGGDPQPLAPEGVTTSGHPIAPDGRSIAVRVPGGTLALMPVAGGEARPIKGASPGDQPVRFSSDGRSLFTTKGNDVPLVVERLDLASGRKEPWRSLAPPDLAGVQVVGPVRLSGDGRGHAYNSARFLSSLWVIAGLR